MKGRKGRRPFVAIEHIKDFNALKASLKGKSFSKNLFRNELRKINIPCNEMFWVCFAKFNLIERVSKNSFAFVDDTPVHFRTLESIYFRYCNKIAEYATNSEEKKIREEKEAQVEKAVKLLKDLGYQIYAPVGDLYSKL